MKVDWLHNSFDIEVALLGSLGFSTEYISGQTGLTEGQVLYRLKKANITRMAYRDGISREANQVVRSVHASLATRLKRTLAR